MKLQEILTPDCIKCLATVSSKKRILELICSLASNKIPDIDQHQLLDSLMDREKMSSTGIGHGIAIPHGRLPNAQKVIAVLITTERSIVFDAIDNQAVDIFIALFVPENCCDEHLSTLQSIARLFNNKDNSKMIRRCQTDEQLFNLIQTMS
jgi:PTS system nitrogen regulatory IIA component